MAYATSPGWAARLSLVQAGKGNPPAAVVKLGLKPLIEGWEPGRLWGQWAHLPEYGNPDGSLFGGYLAALADQLLSLVMMTVLDDTAFMTTADLRLTFFKPVLSDLRWEARVIHLGRRSAHVEAIFSDPQGTILAKASASQAIITGHVVAPEKDAQPGSNPPGEPL